MILTHPGLTKLTFMDYLLTMLRNLLRRKLSYDRVLKAKKLKMISWESPMLLNAKSS